MQVNYESFEGIFGDKHLFGENDNELLEFTINIFVLNTVNNSAP